MLNRHITLQTPLGSLHGQLDLPDEARGLVLLARAHHTPDDRFNADALLARGLAVLGIELLSARETAFADATQNVPLLAGRLIEILDLARLDGDMENLPLAIYASGDVTPAALRAAAQRDAQVKVLAGHGGLIDRAGLQALQLLAAPLLMLFDADDETGPLACQRATAYLAIKHRMQVLKAGEEAISHAADWFLENLPT